MNSLFKFFLWYTKKKGYSCSVWKEGEKSYESYSNFETKIEDNSSFSPNQDLQILEKLEDLQTRISFSGEKKKTYSNPIQPINLKIIPQGEGINLLIARKINEMINSINIINQER